MNLNTAVAQNIKNIREQKKLTLDAAARETGVSRSMLAQIEKGDANPTISVLGKIARGYRVPFTALIEEAPEEATVIPESEIQPFIEDDGRFVSYPTFGFDEKMGFETYRINISPGGSMSSEAHMAGTNEYVTVFGGKLEIVAGEQTFILKEGDSIRFMGDVPHTYRSISREKTKLSMILYYE